MSALGRTKSSFIRCIKPNPSKHANLFNGLLCYEQLQCSGVFEAVTIRRQGYPARMSHLSFYRRFRTLATLSPDASPLQTLKTLKGPEGQTVPEDPKHAAEVLIQVLSQQPALARIQSECQLGKTQVGWAPRVWFAWLGLG
jgi:myosin heavy subunit